MVLMESLSERYGWTPSQIREQRVEDIEQYMQIISVRNKLERRKHNKP